MNTQQDLITISSEALEWLRAMRQIGAQFRAIPIGPTTLTQLDVLIANLSYQIDKAKTEEVPHNANNNVS